jgi:hypothetical protein
MEEDGWVRGWIKDGEQWWPLTNAIMNFGVPLNTESFFTS